MIVNCCGVMRFLMIQRNPSSLTAGPGGRRLPLLLATAMVMLVQLGGLRLDTAIGTFGSTRAEAAEKESWLRRHEAQGGHTLARHVGKDEAWLRERLAQDPRLSRASSFPDVATAEK